MSSSFSRMELTAAATKYAPDAEILAALEKHGAEPRPGADRYSDWPEFLRKIGHKKVS